MRHPFSDLEGLRIAVEMERRGADFYRYAARISKKPEAAALLHQLCCDEERHQREFQARYDAQRDVDGAASELYDAETSAYLSAVAADIVYPGGLVSMAREDGLNSPESILHGAIQSEKDSILFYTEVWMRAKDERSKAIFLEIAEQEKEHLSSLQQMLLEESL